MRLLTVKGLEHILHRHVRVMIAFVLWRLLSVLDRLLGTPLETGKALLTSVRPGDLAVLDLNVAGWTYLLAYQALVALLIYPEALIHAPDQMNKDSVEWGEEDMLPEWPLFKGGAFLVANDLSDS